MELAMNFANPIRCKIAYSSEFYGDKVHNFLYLANYKVIVANSVLFNREFYFDKVHFFST